MGETTGNTRKRARDTRAEYTRKWMRERNLDPRRRRGGQRRLKYEFIVYLGIARYSKVIYFVYHYQNYRKTKSGTQR